MPETLTVGTLTAGWERLLAGGWVSALLLLVVAALGWALVNRQRNLRRVRRELHGGRVRGGHVAESLAPLMEDFPVEVGKPGTTTLFLGQPIDYVHFDPDEGVTFVEVKSGSADLSARQRRFRELVEAGKVRWKTYRVQ